MLDSYPQRDVFPAKQGMESEQINLEKITNYFGCRLLSHLGNSSSNVPYCRLSLDKMVEPIRVGIEDIDARLKVLSSLSIKVMEDKKNAYESLAHETDKGSCIGQNKISQSVSFRPNLIL